MAIVVRFHPQSLTKQNYDTVSAQLKDSDLWPPDGLRLHVCFGEDGDLKVSEIWDSDEQLQAFGDKLMPVLTENGIQLGGEPESYSVHNLETY
jgi:hypothetical protein